MNWLINLITKKRVDGNGIITEIAENIDRFVNSPEDKKEILKMAIEDRQNSREHGDKSLQRVFAITFLISYMGLTTFIIYKFATGMELKDVAMNFVFTIWGGMSAKINTVTDYLFGGSLSVKKEKK